MRADTGARAQKHAAIAPGANILVRDAVWRVVQVDRTSTGDKAIRAVGVSEIVRDSEAIFIDAYERSIEVLDPVDTALVADTSSGYRASLLYLESLLRRMPPTDSRLTVGHRAAMDVVEYQLDPARQALAQPRQRILIADAVGLGKTLEAGVLLSELIARGRGKRILVVTVKSMLTQFQKELWSRFTIPLVRLDSVGLQRIRRNIPTNHNPFHVYNRSIISIDTLKQNNGFAAHVEQAWWDVIVIDEAHNVAARGNNLSLRAKLAKLLAGRSDTLIMLSATPHDGRARSFASLMNMLDPTAIANPDEYSPEDIDGLFIRRFKKDIAHQVTGQFPERKIAKAYGQASAVEEAAFDQFADLTFTRLDQRAVRTSNHAAQLFKTTLEKSLFSSPAACVQSIETRIRNIERRDDADLFAADVAQLQPLADALRAIAPENYGKYQNLLEVIRDKKKGWGWNGQAKDDRLVIFTERIETLKYLAEHLTQDLKLKESAVAILHGSMADIEQQHIVEEFGKLSSPVRLLIASDVASEGINLHFFSHRMIHFDVPWSLMVFQQRNGRIDRYGQEQQPLIVYMLTSCESERIKGDTRILDLLIEKDQQATANIGDPSALMGVYDIDAEERITARAIEEGTSAEAFDAQLSEKTLNPLELLLAAAPKAAPSKPRVASMLSVFEDDYAFLQAALDHLRETHEVVSRSRADERIIELDMPDDLRGRFKKLPAEIMPSDNVLVLTPDADAIQRAIAEARREESTWPRVQFLWPLNAVMEWVGDKMVGAFGRHTAPVITFPTGTLPSGLGAGETVVLVSGLIPNRKSQALVHQWFGVVFTKGIFDRVEDFEATAKRLRLGKVAIPNRGEPIDIKPLERLLEPAVVAARRRILELRETFETEINEKLNAEMTKLESLRARKLAYIASVYADKTGERVELERGRDERAVNRTFDEFLTWVEDTMTSEPEPFLQVLAVLRAP